MPIRSLLRYTGMKCVRRLEPAKAFGLLALRRKSGYHTPIETRHARDYADD
jgi:hypothetical protein